MAGIENVVMRGEEARRRRDAVLRKEKLVFAVIASVEEQNLLEFYAETMDPQEFIEFAQERCPVGGPAGGQFTGPGGANCGGPGGSEPKKRKSRTLRTVDETPKKKTGDFAPDHYFPKATSDDPDYPWGPPPFPGTDKPWGDAYDKKGRSLPGSDDWLAAHGMTREDYDRDFHKEKQGEMSDESRAKLSDPDGRLYSPADKVMAQTDYIVMDRHKVPGSPFSDLTPELRPDNPVVLNNVEKAKAENRLTRMKARLAEAEAMTPEQAVGVQAERVAARQLHLDRVSAVDADGNPTYPGEMRKAAQDRVAEAQEAYDASKGAAVGGKKLAAAEKKLEAAQADMADRERAAAEAKTPGRREQILRTGRERLEAARAEHAAAVESNKSKPAGDPDKVADYKKELDRAKRDLDSTEVKAARFNQVREVAEARNALTTAERRLKARQEDPAAGLVDEIERAKGAVKWAEDGVKKTAVKYAFLGGTRGVDADGLNLAARVGAPPDPGNLRNLQFGNGRVYLAMEGELKASAALARIRVEEPDASVIAVGSVTLWRNPETAWVAREHLRGREVVLLPDADGVTNPAVMREAFALRARLQNEGVDNVRIAAAPLDSNNEIQRLRQTSGAPDDRKGLDDHLGLGGGTLGELRIRDRTVPPREAFDLSAEWAANKRGGEGAIPGLYANSREPTERVLRAISALTRDSGSGAIGADTIADAAGVPRGDSTDRAIARLEALGIIERHKAYTVDEVTQERHPALTPELERRFIREGVLSGRLQEGTFADREEASIYVLRRPELFSKEVVESPRLDSQPVIRQKQDGQHNIATPEGAAYYSELYGIPLSVGDVLPEPAGVTASAYVRFVMERKVGSRNGWRQ